MDVSVRIMEFLLEFHLTFHDAGIFPYIMERFPAVFHGMRSFSYIMERFPAKFHGMRSFSYTMEFPAMGFHDMGFFSYTMEFLAIVFHDVEVFPYIMEGTPLFCIFSESNNPLAPDCFKGQGFSSNCYFVLFCNAALNNRLTADPVSA